MERRYRLTLIILTLISIIIPIIFTIFLIYLPYIRAQRRIARAQANATSAAKALCTTILDIEERPLIFPVRDAIGSDINNACRSLLGTA